ncbi:hypothetical protein OC844_006873 [Tilletia horrida]|nr:hypothetical protein OC844_006873 [Tilletia horrida]
MATRILRFPVSVSVSASSSRAVSVAALPQLPTRCFSGGPIAATSSGGLRWDGSARARRVRNAALPRQRRISFLSQPPPGETHQDEEDDAHRLQYADLFLNTLLSGSTSVDWALAHAETESDVLLVFQRINAQLGLPRDVLPPQRAWAIALQHLLGEDAHGRRKRHSSKQQNSVVELICYEVRSSKKKEPYSYDAGRVYEARSLYNTYLRRLELVKTNDISLGANEQGLSAELVLPLLRAYVHSFVPDIPRAFGLYAEWLAQNPSDTHVTADSQAEAQLYALLIGMCVRNQLHARAMRLVRDLTVRGVAQLFDSGSLAALTVDEEVLPRGRAAHIGTHTLPPLFLTRRDRVKLLSTLMEAASSYAEAYAIYWRLRRMWAGLQADAVSRRLQDRNISGKEPGGLLHWVRRIAARSASYTYLGDGVDPLGRVDKRPSALAYWTRNIPQELDEDFIAAESVLLTEEELMEEDAYADFHQVPRFSLSWILGRVQSRRPKGTPAAVTIYASPEERMAQLSASPFAPREWRYLLSAFLDLPCSWVSLNSSSERAGSGSSSKSVWIPAPPELVTSIFWDMLQAGCPPPPQVYTNLLHYYTRLVKASRQTGSWEHTERLRSDDLTDSERSTARDLTHIQDHQRRLIASEAIASLHKLIHFDIQLAPDLPLINALMNAYGHLGQLQKVLEIWQSLVNLSGGAKLSPEGMRDGKATRVVNRMDAQSVAIVLDACGFSSTSGALTRARKVVAWARHRDRIAMTIVQEVRTNDKHSSNLPADGFEPALLMSKGAWDAWLECLCRRGQVHEALEVFKTEMVPILEEQRRVLNWDRDAKSTTHASDAKTLGTLLRFAARERDVALHAASFASKAARTTPGSAARSAARSTRGVGSAVGSSFFGLGSADAEDGGGGSRPVRRDAETDMWTELRAWVWREMPHLWDAVKDIGAR